MEARDDRQKRGFLPVVERTEVPKQGDLLRLSLAHSHAELAGTAVRG